MSASNDTQYVILHKLGEGGMGTVYLAEDTLLKRKVAIKELNKPTSPNAETLDERFQQEALALARLNHPNITHLYAFIPREGTYWMAMEYVQGKTLEEWIRICNHTSPLIASSILSQLLDGLHHAHRKGIIHRDLKPANVMISEEEGEVKIMDFGIARIRDSQRITQLGKSVGTLEYMSPEQIQGKEGDERTDVYSAGTILYELLVGQPPFRSDTDYLLMRAKLEERPAALPHTIPAALQQVIFKALDRNPDRRYDNVVLFKEALERCFNGKLLKQSELIEALSTPVLQTAPAASTAAPFQWSKNSIKSSLVSFSKQLNFDNAKAQWKNFSIGNLFERIKQLSNNSSAALLLLVVVVLLCAGLLLWNHSRQQNMVLDQQHQPVDTTTNITTPSLAVKDTVVNNDTVPQHPEPNPHFSIEAQPAPVSSNPVTTDPSNDEPEKKNKKITGSKKESPKTTTTEKTNDTPPAQVVVENKPPAPDAGAQEKTTPSTPKDTYTGPVKLPAGMEINVILDETLSSEDVSKDGRPVSLHCNEDVRYDGRTIIRKGSHVNGKVVDVVPSFKSGRRNALIGFVILNVQAVDGSTVRLKSERYREFANSKGQAAFFREGQVFNAKLGRGVVD